MAQLKRWTEGVTLSPDERLRKVRLKAMLQAECLDRPPPHEKTNQKVDDRHCDAQQQKCEDEWDDSGENCFHRADLEADVLTG
jgi:hypothetical protein